MKNTESMENQDNVDESESELPQLEITQIDTTDDDELWSTPQPNEKYIAYLHHSGFHNQRIALENAALVAAILNRTLLIPSAILSRPSIPFARYFENLHSCLMLQTKRGLEHCKDIDAGSPLPMECLDYFEWTAVPWSVFFNLDELDTKVPLVWRKEIGFEWLYQTLDMTEKDIHFIRDDHRYAYRIYDSAESTAPLDKYKMRINLSDLRQLPHRVIHFGSLFGSTRLDISLPENKKLQQYIRHQMFPHDPTVLDAARQIIEELGGVGQYIGIHVRGSDGLFSILRGATVDDIFHELVDQYTDLTAEQIDTLEHFNHAKDRKQIVPNGKIFPEEQYRSYIDRKLTVNHPPPSIFTQRLGDRPENLKRECQPPTQLNRRFQKTVIYIATDLPFPRTNPLFQKIYSAFPCVFDLSDFTEILDKVKRMQVADERVSLQSYMIPLLDAVVAANGKAFIGTNKSTFSQYIGRQLRPVFADDPQKLYSWK